MGPERATVTKRQQTEQRRCAGQNRRVKCEPRGRGTAEATVRCGLAMAASAAAGRDAKQRRQKASPIRTGPRSRISVLKPLAALGRCCGCGKRRLQCRPSEPTRIRREDAEKAQEGWGRAWQGKPEAQWET
ncbi:hypothetical protein ERJ75_000551500 [Trypanosoma vivax]|nr:hypothetical protein ERJ75_000551800 [Trypanosoma vivax]KAH8615764.1 hypothetical protein ERJ75_000551500 [Trypanosoma vivax]